MLQDLPDPPVLHAKLAFWTLVTLYAVTGEPPSEPGALHVITAVLLHDATALTAVGDPGTPVGVTALLAAE